MCQWPGAWARDAILIGIFAGHLAEIFEEAPLLEYRLGYSDHRFPSVVYIDGHQICHLRTVNLMDSGRIEIPIMVCVMRNSNLYIQWL